MMIREVTCRKLTHFKAENLQFKKKMHLLDLKLIFLCHNGTKMISFLTSNVSGVSAGNLGIKKMYLLYLDRNKYHSRGFILGLFHLKNP